MEKKQLTDVEAVENKTCGGVLDIPDLSQGKSIIDMINKANTEKNEDFSKMSKLEKRIVLAKDVIAQIEAKRYTARLGTYLDIRDKKVERYTEDSLLDKSKIGEKNIVCEVCAIGSLFVSNAILSNKKLTDDDDKMLSSLRNIFSKKEMRTLEYLFEGRDIDDMFEAKTHKNIQIKKDIAKYRVGQRGAEQRLVNIMQNIIDNKGNFKYKSILI